MDGRSLDVGPGAVPGMASRGGRTAREIYGDEAVCYGDPLDASSFSQSLCKVLEDSQYQKRLIKNGMETALFYTWDRAFDGYFTVFREMVDL